MKKLFVPFLVLMAFISSCSRENLQETNDDGQNAVLATAQDNSPYQQGVLNVKFTPEFTKVVEKDIANGFEETKSGAFNGVLKEYGVVSLERLFPYDEEYEERTRREGLHRWYKVKYNADAPATKAGSSFTSFEGIEIAEPVHKVVLNDIPFNDTWASKQWHYYNDGKLTADHKAGCDINVVPVWNKYTTGDPSVIVAVVDHAIDFNHEDLKYNFVGGYNYCDGTATLVPGDHGTHVAGTIAATNNNGIGVCGIAGGDYARKKHGVGLYSCQMFSGNHSGNEAACIKGGADHGAVISQNSWGYDFSDDPNPYQSAKEARPAQSLVEAINYFVKYAGCDNKGNQKPDSPMKGGVVFFSAGNDGWDVGPICQYCDVVAVGALGPNFKRAPYSNYGDWVDIAAPGGDVTLSNGGVFSTVTNNEYAFYQGTSMACPHVSGVAALIISACGGQGFTNEDLKTLLIGGAKKSYGGAGVMEANKIGPLVDALGSIESANVNPPQPIKEYTASAKANVITFNFKVTGTSDSKPVMATSYLLLAGKTRSSIDGIKDFSKIPSDVESLVVSTDGKEIGDEMSVPFEVKDFESTYYVAIVGSNREYYSTISPIKSVTTGKNNPPVITTDYTGDYKIKSHLKVPISFSIYDPDGHAINVSFSSGYPETTQEFVVAWAKEAEGKYTATFDGVHAVPGKYTFVITAKDKYSSTEFKQEYVFLENQAPKKVKDIERVFLPDEFSSATVKVSDCIVDPDGEVLTWSCMSSDATIAVATPKEGSITVSALAPGMTTITVTGKDARGLSASASFAVLVYNVDNPVNIPSSVDAKTDVLSFSAGGKDNEDVYVRLTASTGKLVYENTFNVSGFDSIDIPIDKCAPGVYTIYVKSSSIEYTKSFVRL